MRTRSPLAVILSLFLLMPFLGTIQPEPAEASDEMLDRANYHCGCGFEDVYKNLVAVSPYTQENPNG